VPGVCGLGVRFGGDIVALVCMCVEAHVQYWIWCLNGMLCKFHTTAMIVKRWMKCVHDDAAHFEIKGDTRKDKDNSKLCWGIE
jgi:hypothetical protein